MNKEERLVKQITPKSEDFSRWYIELIRRAELADYAPLKGMMVIRPYGYAIWENIQRLLDRRIKATGHQNAYFPLFIPESFLQKETEHLKGFSPEVAWVTQGGQEELEERLAVRPTSEAIIGYMYAKWIKSWRDLPVLINQWANIVRWEKVTRPFLRTTEFLWQEGHTAHETREEAEEETRMILEMYREFVETELAVPVIAGRKTEREKFAGALETYSIEGLMADGRALQMGTSHHLGQHFSRVFNIRFEDRQQQLQYVWQTSWGVSTRLIGAVVMCHGDDSGLKFPPQIAPLQVIIVPISLGNWQETVLPLAKELRMKLQEQGFRVHLDAREEYTPGWKFSEWEMRGVPLRLEIGPRDVKQRQIVLVRRDTREKITVSLEESRARVSEILDDIQKNLFHLALRFQQENTYETNDYREFQEIIEQKRGFIKSYWCGRTSCEEKIKEETQATIRVIPLEQPEDIKNHRCLHCGQPAKWLVYFAKAY
ncbi:MAG: proline--tRNA ligase [Candidatus Aminicenantes bacterium]|nr:proline--tRNA ligase [Candidatus Aminicenantes bacterium]OQX53061.1 MAG: proline--tRNA ligase [Candidatus Aminicenantes bacterium 4484_214]RLE03515.1 MAG: proline--tRNA ligase [Candidatus Aminicenantes bacterium]